MSGFRPYNGTPHVQVADIEYAGLIRIQCLKCRRQRSEDWFMVSKAEPMIETLRRFIFWENHRDCE